MEPDYDLANKMRKENPEDYPRPITPEMIQKNIERETAKDPRRVTLPTHTPLSNDRKLDDWAKSIRDLTLDALDAGADAALVLRSIYGALLTNDPSRIVAFDCREYPMTQIIVFDVVEMRKGV